MLRLIHFWRIAIVIAALTTFYFLPTFAVKAMGIGASTICRTFVASRADTKFGAGSNMRTWILGYATGANEIAMMTNGHNYLAGMSDATLLANVANYCAAHPEMSLQTAARYYLQEVQ